MCCGSVPGDSNKNQTVALISCDSDMNNVNAPYGKAINIYFGKLLFHPHQGELSFVVITFNLIGKHQRTDVQYRGFHGNHCVCLIIILVRSKRQVKLSVIKIGMCVM